MSAKIFTDSKAKRRFVDIYEMLEEPQKSEFARRIREAARDKVESLDDNLSDYYLTEEDVNKCAEGTKWYKRLWKKQ